MKTNAAVFYEPNVPFSVETLELEPPKEKEVLVKVSAAGICHSDWHLMTGATQHATPVVAGHEGAGVVVDVGKEVTQVKPGDHIILNWAPNCGTCFYCLHDRPNLCRAYVDRIWDGTMMDGTTRFSKGGQPYYHFSAVSCFSEQIVVPQESCVPVNKEVPLTIAALIGCAVTTGVGAVLNTAKVKPGSTIVVFGVGGVGLSIIMGAKLVKAKKIIAVDTKGAKGVIAQSFGADDFLIARPDTHEKIRSLTGGRGADYVFEAVGLPEVQEESLKAVRPGGTAVLVGISPMGSSTNLPGAIITRQEKTVMGCYYGTANPARDFPLIGDLFLKGELDLEALITKTYSLGQVNEAYDDMLHKEMARGVIVFDQ